MHNVDQRPVQSNLNYILNPPEQGSQLYAPTFTSLANSNTSGKPYSLSLAWPSNNSSSSASASNITRTREDEDDNDHPIDRWRPSFGSNSHGDTQIASRDGSSSRGADHIEAHAYNRSPAATHPWQHPQDIHTQSFHTRDDPKSPNPEGQSYYDTHTRGYTSDRSEFMDRDHHSPQVEHHQSSQRLPPHSFRESDHIPPIDARHAIPERTPVSYDYDSENFPASRVREPSLEPIAGSSSGPSWQHSDRASVRLAARGSAETSSSSRQRFLGSAVYEQQGLQYNKRASHTRETSAENEQNLTAPSKRAKRPKVSSGPSRASSKPASERKGNSLKKKNKGAIFADPQSMQFVNVYSRSQQSETLTNDSFLARPSTETDSSSTEATNNRGQYQLSGPMIPELQHARCMSFRYRQDEFPRCVACTRRWAGDTCRFQNIRFLIRNTEGQIVGLSFTEVLKGDLPTMSFPTKWNVDLQKSEISRIKLTIANALLPVLKHEMVHLRHPQIIHRPRESDVRATCDTCMTSIFSSSWMCRICGREACSDCFETVRDLTVNPQHGTPEDFALLSSKRDGYSKTNPFFLQCNKRVEHTASQFSPVSRFCREELQKVIDQMEELREQSGSCVERLNVVKVPPSISPSTTPRHTLDIQHIKDSPGPTEPHVAPSHIESLPTHTHRRFSKEQLSEDLFRSLWANGEPLVVTGLKSNFKFPWDSEFFAEQYKAEPCVIIECQAEINKKSTVGEFFNMFGQYEGRQERWKLKDFPPAADFMTTFPSLYHDFSDAVPMPNYVRRDGISNLASHFPKNAVAPDLGPKMYNAMASSTAAGSKGSTRLHMDMADAVNIMTHAEPCPDGSPGCAAWDLFNASDSEKIREFLRCHFKCRMDPIHSQQFYLDDVLRQQLWDECQVASFRIYQRPGEAVFIPAGCAHQVSNLSDCIKIAIDFVSPENIDRCEKLTKEFREQNQSQVWKEDVLQLRTMMWFAWLSCCKQEEELAKTATIVKD